MLLNDRIILNAAAQLANRANDEATSADPATRIQRAWQIVYGHPANEIEIQNGLKFVSEQRQILASSSGTNLDVTTQTKLEDEAFADLCHAMLNTNEFLFIE